MKYFQCEYIAQTQRYTRVNHHWSTPTICRQMWTHCTSLRTMTTICTQNWSTSWHGPSTRHALEVAVSPVDEHVLKSVHIIAGLENKKPKNVRLDRRAVTSGCWHLHISGYTYAFSPFVHDGVCVRSIFCFFRWYTSTDNWVPNLLCGGTRSRLTRWPWFTTCQTLFLTSTSIDQLLDVWKY